MPFMEWSDDLNLGIESIDQQHKQIIAILNNVFEGLKSGASKETLHTALADMIAYAEKHFSYEEDLFEKTGYPEAQAHKREHQALREKVSEFQNKLDDSHAGLLSLDVMNFLKAWIESHLNGTDKKYVAHFLGRGIR